MHKIKNKIIFVNSEPLYVKKFKHLANFIKNDNIICWIDYTNKNIELIKKINTKNKHVILNKFICSNFNEIHYNNYITTDMKSCEKDIDILFYGGVSDRRKYILNSLSKKHKVVNIIQPFTKIYDYINRAKIVIVVHFYCEDLPVDYYRISSLVSNKIFFIHEDVQEEDKHLKEGGIIFSKYDDLTNTCDKYINMTQEERNIIAKNIYEYLKKNNTYENTFPVNFIKFQSIE